MTIEPLISLNQVVPLLIECGLPASDVSIAFPHQFFGLRLEDSGPLVGIVGLENYQSVGLLRSLAVASPCRNRGPAHQLVAFVEAQAAYWHIDTLFLLTTTAESFFTNLGYSSVSRDTAPPAIQATSQFSGLCPATSAFLSKHVTNAG